MKRALSAVSLLTLCLTWVAPATAQVPDHLKCYKIRDTQPKATYTADLGGLVAEPGCVIKVPAKLACVPATKTNVTPTPPGTGGTGTPNAFGCYKVKCPTATLPAFALNDQFGSRSVTPSTPKLLCTPVSPPTTTTTTTAPTCANGGIAFGAPCGTCLGGVCVAYTPSSCLTACDPAQPPVCIGSIVPDTACNSNAMCPAGTVCVAGTNSEGCNASANCGTGGNFNFCAFTCPE